MKTKSKYQEAKAILKEIAKNIKKENTTDKPMQRMVINNHLDFLCKNLNLSDYQRDLLANYACKLHHY